jgi:hypothetical protein
MHVTMGLFEVHEISGFAAIQLQSLLDNYGLLH